MQDTRNKKYRQYTEIKGKKVGIIINPVEIYNHELVLKKAENNEISYAFEIYDDKTLTDYKGNIMATAPYSFYTKESINRLVELWCSNTIEILNNNPKNFLKQYFQIAMEKYIAKIIIKKENKHENRSRYRCCTY